MREVGQVVHIEGKTTTIIIKRKASCGSCTACGMGENQNEMSLKVANDLGAKLGDWIELDLGSLTFLKASSIVYLLPLAALILGVVGGYALAKQLSGNTEFYGALGGILFTVLAFMGLKLIDPLLNKKGEYSPRMVSIINLYSEGEIIDGKQ